MVIVTREMKQAMDHKTRHLFRKGTTRPFGPSSGNFGAHVDLCLYRLGAFREVEREHVGRTVFPAKIPVQFANAFGPDEDNADLAAASWLLSVPKLA